MKTSNWGFSCSSSCRRKTSSGSGTTTNSWLRAAQSSQSRLCWGWGVGASLLRQSGANKERRIINGTLICLSSTRSLWVMAEKQRWGVGLKRRRRRRSEEEWIHQEVTSLSSPAACQCIGTGGREGCEMLRRRHGNRLTVFMDAVFHQTSASRNAVFCLFSPFQSLMLKEECCGGFISCKSCDHLHVDTDVVLKYGEKDDFYKNKAIYLNKCVNMTFNFCFWLDGCLVIWEVGEQSGCRVVGHKLVTTSCCGHEETVNVT